MAGNKPGSKYLIYSYCRVYTNHELEPTSKRKTVRLRHKIEKASAQKQRKARKQAKQVRILQFHSRLELQY